MVVQRSDRSKATKPSKDGTHLEYLTSMMHASRATRQWRQATAALDAVQNTYSAWSYRIIHSTFCGDSAPTGLWATMELWRAISRSMEIAHKAGGNARGTSKVVAMCCYTSSQGPEEIRLLIWLHSSGKCNPKEHSKRTDEFPPWNRELAYHQWNEQPTPHASNTYND